MEIKWFGQACFEIKSAVGAIVTDPFSDKIGWPMPRLLADVLTISHSHYDHNNREQVATQKIIDRSGEESVGEIKIGGYPAWHDATQGSQRGSVVLFKFLVEGISLLHLGDLGVLLTPDQIQTIGPIDILLIPVGGVYTIDAGEAKQTIDQLKPKIIIPMHYYLPGISETSLRPVDDFVTAMADTTPEYLDQLIITTKTELEKPARLVILKRAVI